MYMDVLILFVISFPIKVSRNRLYDHGCYSRILERGEKIRILHGSCIELPNSVSIFHLISILRIGVKFETEVPLKLSEN